MPAAIGRSSPPKVAKKAPQARQYYFAATDEEIGRIDRIGAKLHIRTRAGVVRQLLFERIEQIERGERTC